MIICTEALLDKCYTTKSDVVSVHDFDQSLYSHVASYYHIR